MISRIAALLGLLVVGACGDLALTPELARVCGDRWGRVGIGWPGDQTNVGCYFATGVAIPALQETRASGEWIVWRSNGSDWLRYVTTLNGRVVSFERRQPGERFY